MIIDRIISINPTQDEIYEPSCSHPKAVKKTDTKDTISFNITSSQMNGKMQKNKASEADTPTEALR